MNLNFQYRQPSTGCHHLQAWLGDREVAFLAWSRQTGEVYHINTCPGFRRCGVATATVEHARKLARKHLHISEPAVPKYCRPPIGSAFASAVTGRQVLPTMEEYAADWPW